MESVEVDVSLKSSNNPNSEEIQVENEVNSDKNVSFRPPKSPQKVLSITNSYNLSTFGLILIAITMSSIVIIGPGSQPLPKTFKIPGFFENDILRIEPEFNGVNSSYIAPPETSKFEYIHGQLKDLSACLILYNITDQTGACLVHQELNFFEASDECKKHNMTLLEFNSDYEMRRVFEETEKIFGSGGGTRVWMNGLYSEREKAFLTHPKNEKFFVTIDMVEGRGSYTAGNCLAVESWISGRYHIGAPRCQGSHYFYCEF